MGYLPLGKRRVCELEQGPAFEKWLNNGKPWL